MSRLQEMIVTLLLVALMVSLSGCAGMNQKAEDINFSKLGGFADRNGQVKILLISYTGEPEKEDIRGYTVNLGCGIVLAYYYSDKVDRNTIPIRQLEAATNFGAAQDLLFKDEGTPRWQFASQCIGMNPTLTDCRKSSISTNCR